MFILALTGCLPSQKGVICRAAILELPFWSRAIACLIQPFIQYLLIIHYVPGPAQGTVVSERDKVPVLVELIGR